MATRDEKRALYNVLDPSKLGSNLKKGYEQTKKDISSNPTLGMMGDTLLEEGQQYVNDKLDYGMAGDAVYVGRKLGADVEGGPVDTFNKKGLVGLAKGAAATATDAFNSILEASAPAVSKVLYGSEGDAVQKAQGGAGMGSIENTDFSGTGAGSTNMKTAPSLGDFNTTQNRGMDSANAPGISVEGDTMTYRPSSGGSATISGPGVGKVNWSRDRLESGVSTIGDWAGEQSKANQHQMGLNRLRAGLPYDAKEAAAMQAASQARKDAKDDAWLADYNARSRQDELLKRIDQSAGDLERQASWAMRGSNPNRRLAESLYEKSAAIRGGAYGQAIAGNANIAQADVTGRAALGTAGVRADGKSTLDAKDVFDMQYKQAQLANEDRRFKLDVTKAGEQMGTDRARLGLTQQDQENQAANNQAKVLGDMQKNIRETMGSIDLDAPTKRRQALVQARASGLDPRVAAKIVLGQDSDALRIITEAIGEDGSVDTTNLSRLSDVYPKDVVDAQIREILGQRQAYK